MSPRTLAILNAIGCLALTALVVVQWRGERASEQSLATLRSELAEAGSHAAAQAERRVLLERDIAVLKETIANSQQSAESAARDFEKQNAVAGRLQADLEAARGQVAAWESALAMRDERILKLEAELAAARKRLDEAIAKLKAAGAR